MKKICYLLIAILSMNMLLTPFVSEASDVDTRVSDAVNYLNENSEYVVNPMLEGALDNEIIIEEHTVFHQQLQSDGQDNKQTANYSTEDDFPIGVCFSLADAGRFLATQMVAREETIAIILFSNPIEGTADLGLNVLSRAFQYNEEDNGSFGDTLWLSYEKYESYFEYSYEDGCYIIAYEFAYLTSYEDEVEMALYVEDVLESLNLDNKNEYEKVRAIYDYIYNTIEPNQKYLNNTAYHAIVNKYGSHYGYSLLFYRLCKDAGLQVRVIFGEEEGVYSTWNIVKIGNAYYYVDCFLDDLYGNMPNYDFFLKNKKDFLLHWRYEDYHPDYDWYFPISEKSWVFYDELATPLNASNYSYEFTNANGIYNTSANGKPKLLVFYSITPSCCYETIKSIIQEKMSDLDILFIEAEGKTDKQVQNFIREIGAYRDNIQFVNHVNGNSTTGNIRSLYVNMGTASNEWPLFVYINADNKVQYVDSGLSSGGEVKAKIDYYCYGQRGPIGIIDHPESLELEEGEKATFDVNAYGNGLTYQWQLKSPSENHWIEIARNKSIDMTVSEDMDGNQYRCIVTDANGNQMISNTATLNIDKKIVFEITSQPSTRYINEGTNTTFSIQATGEGLKYQWQYKLPGTSEWRNSTITGYNTDNMTITATAARNNYQYRCVVTDANGNKLTSNVVSLMVKILFAINDHPASQTVDEGKNVTFAISANGSGLTYQWQYRTSSKAEWKKSTMAGATTNSIIVQGTTARNGYQYRCVVKDTNGKQIVSNVATLTVKAGTVFAITSQPSNKEVELNGNATFAVKASGNGLTYQWQYRTSATAEWKKSTMAGATTASITVQGTTARNGYQYRCVVKDANGKQLVSNAATLTVKAGSGTSFAITTHPASKEVELNANATFKVVAIGEGLTYQWQYRLNANAEWKVSGMTGAKTDSITVQGTTARNGYQYRCVVKDANGKQLVSNAATLTVKQGSANAFAITSQPANHTVTEGTKVTFSVAATGEGLKYQWQYRTSATAAWKNSGMTGATTNSITVEATAARNGYQYRCVVFDGTGARIDSNPGSLTVSVGQITKLAITSQPESKTVALNENATYTVVAEGEGLTYQWQYRTSATAEWKKSGMVGSTTNSITVQGTTARNGYQYRCVVKDANGKQLVSQAADLIVK